MTNDKIENSAVGTFIFNPEPAFIFHNAELGEILKFEHNGDIFVKGKLIENDKEIVNALREFLKLGVPIEI